MHVCLVDAAGNTLVHKNIEARPERFLNLIGPYREGLAVTAECMFAWYWLADLCQQEQITFVLGHALYMKAIHGGKVKNDKIDSQKIALLLRCGMLAQAYAYPRAMRAPGHPQAMFAVELMMDHLAETIGMDPLEFRLMNETSNVRKEMLKVGAELIGWKENRKKGGESPGTIKRGFGIGAGDWGNGGGRATIQVNVYRNGTIEVVSGAQDIGPGYRVFNKGTVGNNKPARDHRVFKPLQGKAVHGYQNRGLSYKGRTDPLIRNGYATV
jgi:hypothetical protein